MKLDIEVIVANASGTPITKDVDSYTTFASTEHCGPWPGICLFNVPQYDGLLFDPISSIEAFSVCMNGVRGDEDLYYRITSTENVTNVVPECNDTSNSSMLVFALGKRLETDSLVEQVGKSTRPQNYPTRESAVTNLRKVYTLTVGRLSWEAKDLATDIHAKCMSDADSKCFGLAYDLQNGKQKLLVSTEKLPLKQLNQQFRGEISFNGLKRLVEVVDTPAMSLIEPDPEFFIGLWKQHLVTAQR